MEKSLREESKRNWKSMAWTIPSATNARAERRCPRLAAVRSRAWLRTEPRTAPAQARISDRDSSSTSVASLRAMSRRLSAQDSSSLNRRTHSGRDLGAEKGAMRELTTCLSQGDQVPGQIAAVHGGNIHGIQRPEVPGVVPVDEVATDAVQVRHGLERGFKPFRRVQNPDPAEIVGDRRAEQIEPQIRRRRAVGFGGLGVFLEVVRRKGMILLVHERLEEAPGPAGDEPQRARLLGGEDL